MQKLLMHPRFEQISYEDAGTGPAVVLLHGFPFSSSIFQGLIERLSGKYRTIAPDFPGAGSTSALLHPEDASMELLAELVKVILDQEKVEQCVLVGHSMGGYVAMAFADAYADRMKGLCLLHSTAYEDSEEKRQARVRSIQFIQTHGSELFLKQMVPGLFASHYVHAHPDEVNQIVKQSQRIPAEMLIAYYRAMMKRPDRSYLLRTLRIPIAFVFGKEDTSLLLDQALSMISLPGDSTVHVLEQTGHMSMIEHPRLARLLDYFIDYCEASLIG
ncbi:alpha/beta fold hydrolase [Thermoflavifilum aggregans]|nr:alpha/beta hydrolase [Thermoflavifilum aggregans]